MKKFKDYMLSVLGSLLVAVVIAIAISGVLAVADTDKSIIHLVLQIIILIVVIYLIISFVLHRRREFWKNLYEKEWEEKLKLKEEMTDSQQEISDYFLTWVHQIKTPITAAKLLADDDPQLKSELISIETYTNMAMEFLKAINDDASLTLTATPVDAMVRPLIKKYSTLFIDRGITLEYVAIQESVVTDSQLASVVIEQLLSNAVKYTYQGKVSITFSSETNTLAIRDTGLGIEATDLPKIFDRGYSGLNGRQNEKSSGIGLFLAKKIGEKLNLKLTVESEPGTGSCFYVEFPRTIY